MATLAAKLFAYAVGGAILGGAVVHVVEKPQRPAAVRKTPVRKAPIQPSSAAQPPCALPAASQWADGGIHPLAPAYAAPGAAVTPPSKATPDRLKVPAPEAGGLLGLAVLALAALRRWKRAVLSRNPAGQPARRSTRMSAGQAG